MERGEAPKNGGWTARTFGGKGVVFLREIRIATRFRGEKTTMLMFLSTSNHTHIALWDPTPDLLLLESFLLCFGLFTEAPRERLQQQQQRQLERGRRVLLYIHPGKLSQKRGEGHHIEGGRSDGQAIQVGGRMDGRTDRTDMRIGTEAARGRKSLFVLRGICAGDQTPR